MMTKRVLASIAVIGALAATLIGGPHLRAASDESGSPGLQGSWEIKITQPDYSPLPVGLDFRILRTVTSEGVIDAYAFPGFGPTGPQPGLVANPGHGTWEKAGGERKYNVTVKYFQTDQSAFPYVLNSIGRVTEQITLARDGESYTSQFVTQIYSPDGTLIFTNAGGTIARRNK